MKDHTDNKMNLSLDYSLQLSMPLDNKHSIPMVGANWWKAGTLQMPSLHHLSPPSMTMSPCKPTQMKESCVNRREQHKCTKLRNCPSILCKKTSHRLSCPPYWRHCRLHCSSSSMILVSPRQPLTFQPIDSSPPDNEKNKFGRQYPCYEFSPLSNATQSSLSCSREVSLKWRCCRI